MVTRGGGRRRPILLREKSVNQRLPSGLAAIPSGPGRPTGGSENFVMTPAGVIRPILSPLNSVNQRLPSGPAVMPVGEENVGRGNSVKTPAGVIRLILSCSVNQRLPSGPAAMAAPGPADKDKGSGNSL